MKRPAVINDLKARIEPVELKGFARGVAEIEWLLLVLVLLYLFVTGTFGGDLVVTVALLVFAVFVVVFRHTPLLGPDTRLKVAMEVWAMFAFLTVVLLYTGRTTSPLLNLYLLPVILSALTLGKGSTIFHVGLVAACYLFLGEPESRVDLVSLTYGAQLLTVVVPFLLAAVLTAIFVADVREAQEKIRILSETDDLTGLYNMRAFQQMHDREHQKAERYNREYSVLIVDIDRLKLVNDTYGHEAGNQVIIEVANIISRVVRTTDVAARFGGDEFIVMLTESSASEAADVALRVRNSIGKMTMSIGKKMIRTSASIGLASYPNEAVDMRELRTLADRRMYEDKQSRK